MRACYRACDNSQATIGVATVDKCFVLDGQYFVSFTLPFPHKPSARFDLGGHGQCLSTVIISLRSSVPSFQAELCLTT